MSEMSELKLALRYHPKYAFQKLAEIGWPTASLCQLAPAECLFATLTRLLASLAKFLIALAG